MADDARNFHFRPRPSPLLSRSMKSTTRDGILRGGRAAMIRLLLLAAAGISGYLLSVSFSGGQVAGCGQGSSCDAVLQSQWSRVLGLPVSALALIVDLALLLTTFSCGPKSTPKQRRGAWEILTPGAVMVLGAALWFTALQVFVLQRYCPWCLTAHAAGAVAATLLMLRVPISEARERRDKDPGASPSKLIKSGAFALVAVAALGVTQSFAPGKTYSVTVMPEAAKSTPASPTLDVFGGRVRLNLAEVPVWGSPSAPNQLISLFDYTCSHCREMHERVAEVQRSFGERLSVVSLPMPLDMQCNKLIKRTHPKQTNACTYARIGLAVARAKREAVQPFDHWFFTPATPPPLVEVTNQAVQLIGADALAKALNDPWIDTQLSASMRLFEISAIEYKNGSMPQFMIGTNIFTGLMTTEQLREKVAPYVTAP
jgi:uncharacterized membrane protein